MVPGVPWDSRAELIVTRGVHFSATLSGSCPNVFCGVHLWRVRPLGCPSPPKVYDEVSAVREYTCSESPGYTCSERYLKFEDTSGATISHRTGCTLFAPPETLTHASPRPLQLLCSATQTWVRRTTRSHQTPRKLRRVPQVGGSGSLAPRRRRAPSGSTTSSRSAASRHCCLSGLSTAAFNQLHAHCVHTACTLQCTAAAAMRRARGRRGGS